MSRNNPFHTWIGFTRALESEFGTSPYECPRANLFKLSQVGIVHDYYAKFTALSNRVYGVSTDALLDCFISGLKPEIRRDVIAQTPTSLLRSVSLAKLYEEKYTSKPKPYHPIYFPKPPTTTSNFPMSQTHKSTNFPPLLPTPHPHPGQNIPKPSNLKRMSPVEMQLQREKGLCYTCDEKFSPSHKFPNKQYLLLQVEASDNEEPEPDPPDHIGQSECHRIQEHHLSYNALNGSSGLGSMQF
ncbi:hypothetical protein SESBI_39217 [Sesbania bispinosa]|nr:hypothetical protein SESBI_39217 [Sesbania bispinosa]